MKGVKCERCEQLHDGAGCGARLTTHVKFPDCVTECCLLLRVLWYYGINLFIKNDLRTNGGNGTVGQPVKISRGVRQDPGSLQAVREDMVYEETNRSW